MAWVKKAFQKNFFTKKNALVIKKEVEEYLMAKGSDCVPVKVYLWILAFEVYIIFKGHEILFVF